MSTASEVPVMESAYQLFRSWWIVSVYTVGFWSADRLLSPEGREVIWRSITANTIDVNASLLFFDRYLGIKNRSFIFIGRMALLSIMSLVTMLVGYSYLIPEFRIQFLYNSDARGLFIRGIITEGFFTVFMVNWGATALAVNLRKAHVSPPLILVSDFVARLVLFTAIIAVVYFYSAVFFGSFVGSTQAALGAVLPTVADAVRFENITGAYLYASATSGFPLFIAGVLDLMQRSPVFKKVVTAFFFFLPFHKHPIRSVSFVIAVFAASFSAVAWLTLGQI